MDGNAERQLKTLEERILPIFSKYVLLTKVLEALSFNQHNLDAECE